MIDQKYVDMIFDQVDVSKVIGEYVNLTKKGTRMWGCCPFHKENTPSFSVNLANDLWYCHGCQKGGNVINFIMEMENMPYPMAVKKLLRDELHINLEDADLQSTPEEEARFKRLESMRIINKHLSDFFYTELYKETPEAKAARGYLATRKWEDNFCKEMRIGYAPDNGRDVVDFCEKKGLDLGLLQEMGILKMSEKSHALYCVYRNRIMIPIRDRYSNIEGFTARTMDEEKDGRKYINSSNSDLYDKSKSIFGISMAMREAKRTEKMFLVEGGPDVLKLQSVGITNTIASLGGAWTKEQFQKLRECRMQNVTLCFIPDSDVPKAGEKLGAGFKNVLKNGALAMQSGFTVTVREIPNDLETDHPKKVDPDEFIDKPERLASLTEKEFLIWYVEKKFDKEAVMEEKQKVIEEVADLLILVKSEETQESYLSELAKLTDGTKGLWRQALNSAKRRKQEKLSDKNKKDGIDMLKNFGFREQYNSYYGMDKDGDDVRWSNFCLKPLFHIKDDLRPVRLFEIKNDEPEDKAEIIELDMDTFTSSKSLRKKLLGIGNYIWMAGDEQLISMQRYLAKVTETAVEIKQLGWQREGFYAFSNGTLNNDGWHDIDKLGIVRMEEGIYYLPAFSELYKNSKELYINERKFRYTNYSNISLHDYFTRICTVFGDNAKIALAFYVGSLFADVIRGHGIKIPILNLFGQPGTGKTEFAQVLMSFFLTDANSPNIESSVPSLADHIASVSNALVHIDEYKNSIDEKKSQFLKDLWNGVGRMRMNMDKDKKREQARVDSVLVLTGQEMPTVDFALFTRLIYLSCDKKNFSEEDKKNFDELMKFRMMGATHITLEILKHREKVVASIGTAWKKADSDLKFALRDEQLAVDRLRQNWSVVLTSYLVLNDSIDWPFTYEELLHLCTEGCKKQNGLCSTVDEVAGFWQIINVAIQQNQLVKDQDFCLKYVRQLKVTKAREPIEFVSVKAVLMIRKDIFLSRYMEIGNRMKVKVLPRESIQKYLENTHEHFGTSSTPVRFKKFNSNGFPEVEIKKDASDRVVSAKTVWYQDRPICFDYDLVSQKYNIMLVSGTGDDNDQEELPVAQQQNLPFAREDDTSD